MTLRRIGVGLLLAVTCLVATLAIPVRLWRTGRTSVSPLTLSVPDAARVPGRIWVDTDAACGYTPRTDADDCLALWFLATRRVPEVVGVSTVFGNAPLDVTDSTTRALVHLVAPTQGSNPIGVHRGLPDVLSPTTSGGTPARDALTRALAAGPLTIVALGPVTNVVDALRARPDLRANVEQLVAVMGRRIGHLFHPSEGSGRGSFLGHGPVFRDFNFTSDRDAVRALIQMNLPLTLIPYDAATHVEITPEDLRRLATHGDAGAWIASRSQPWLEYWRTQIGRTGFYPFDLMAAAYITAPALFRCAEVHAWVDTDPVLPAPLFRPEALLIDQRGTGTNRGAALYCPVVEAGFEAELRSWIHRPSRL